MLAANVVTDLPDYAPGATAHIFASDFALSEPVQFQVLHNDGTPNTGNGHLPWTVVDGSVDDLDGLVDGNIHTTWYVDPDDSANSAFDLTALGLTSGLEAATTFTDAPNPDYQHFANKAPVAWQNGALQSTNSIYFEGDVVPHWYEIAKAVEGVTYSFNIYYDYRKDLAIDEGGFVRLNTYNFTENPPLAGAAAPVIDNAFPEAGNIYTVNANVTTIAGPVEVAGSTNQRYVTVTFVANDGDLTAGEEITAEFYWGLQLAQPGDVGPLSKGASAFSGASLQTDVNVVGSSRVDLQACKLEYSIVSPK